MSLVTEEHGQKNMGAGDCCVLPAQFDYALSGCSDNLELLEVTLPADFTTL
jgi:hypothetical protein